MKQGERNIVEKSASSAVISYCLSTNQSKDERTFQASTSIISCVRERTFYAMCAVDDDRYFKNTKSFASLQD